MGTGIDPKYVFDLRRRIGTETFSEAQELVKVLAEDPQSEPVWRNDFLDDGTPVGMLQYGSEILFFREPAFRAARDEVAKLQAASDLEVLGRPLVQQTEPLSARLSRAADSVLPAEHVATVMRLAEDILSATPAEAIAVQEYAQVFNQSRQEGLADLQEGSPALLKSSAAHAANDVIRPLCRELRALKEVLGALGKEHLVEKVVKMAVLISWAQFNAGNYQESVKHARDVTLSVLSYSLAEEHQSGRPLSDHAWLARLGTAWGHDVKNSDMLNLITHPQLSGAVTQRAAELAGVDPKVAEVMGLGLAKLNDDQSFPIYDVLVPYVFGPKTPFLPAGPSTLEHLLDRTMAQRRREEAEWLPGATKTTVMEEGERAFYARVTEAFAQGGQDRDSVLATLRGEARTQIERFYTAVEPEAALPPWVAWVTQQCKMPIVEQASRASDVYVTAFETMTRWSQMAPEEVDATKPTAVRDVEALSPSKIASLYPNVMEVMRSYVGKSIPDSVRLFRNRPTEQPALARSSAQKVAFMLELARAHTSRGVNPRLGVAEGGNPRAVRFTEAGKLAAKLRVAAIDGTVPRILELLIEARDELSSPTLWGEWAEVNLKPGKDARADAVVEGLSQAFNRFLVGEPAGPLYPLLQALPRGVFEANFPEYFAGAA